MYIATCINKENRRVVMSFTGVTSITDSSTNKVITVGGVTITIAASEWDLLVAEYIPATT